MTERNICISIYSTLRAVEQALGKLQTESIDLKQVSVVGKGFHKEEHPIGFHATGDGLRFWGHQGSFWDGVWSLESGAAFFWVPGLGPLAAVGPIVTLLVRGLEGVAIGGGLGVLGAALYGMGVPRNSIAEYEQEFKAEKLLLIVHGQRSDVERACGILHNETQQVAVHTA